MIRRTTSSYVAFTDTGRLIGDATKNQVAMNPCNSGFDAKRLIGRRVSDPSVQSNIKLQPFKVMSGPVNRPLIQVTYKGEEKQFAAEEISSMVLIKMREIPDKKMKELEGICNPIIANTKLLMVFLVRVAEWLGCWWKWCRS